MLKLWHHLHIYFRTWWFDYEISFFLSLFFHSLSQYVSCCFYSNIWIHFPHFHPGAGYNSYFWTVLSPSYSNKTPCLVFHWCWFLHHIARYPIWSTLAIFPKLTTFSGNSHPWGETVNRTPSPTFCTIQHPQKQPLQSLPCPPISWYYQTQPSNKSNKGRLDQSKTTLHGLVFSRSNSYHHPKVLWPSTPTITTNATNVCLIYPNSTDNQMIELGRGTSTKCSFNTIEDSEEEEICVEDDSTQTGGIVMFLPHPTPTSSFLFHHYLITLLQGHMAIHTIAVWLTFFLISDSLNYY